MRYQISWIDKHSAVVEAESEEEAKEIALDMDETETYDQFELVECVKCEGENQ